MSIRLETANRFIGIFFIASIGILVTLLTLTYLESYTTTVVVESSLNVETYPATWVSVPSYYVVEIAAGVTIVLGILYLGLKRLYRQMSEEVFP
jgi:hypothetical protein